MLFYFAGHGIALDGDDGPEGFLIPQDANAADPKSFLPMTELSTALNGLLCRHLLAILDCCFAGSFRWAGGTRTMPRPPEVIHKERYLRYIKYPAWQIVTSAAYDQQALDVVGGQVLGRTVRRIGMPSAILPSHAPCSTGSWALRISCRTEVMACSRPPSCISSCARRWSLCQASGRP